MKFEIASASVSTPSVVRSQKVASGSQSQICSFCVTTILHSKLNWDYHHASCEELERSAISKCPFCLVLFEDIKPLKSSFHEQDSSFSKWIYHETLVKVSGSGASLPIGDTGPRTGALYRWSVRSLGRTRDTKHMIAITFRTIPSTIGTFADAEHLPERTFYCFPEQDLGTLFNANELGTTTNPERNGGVQITEWMKTCNETHRHCPKPNTSQTDFLPTRLLDVGTTGSTDPIRVVETKHHSTPVLGFARFPFSSLFLPARANYVHPMVSGPYATLSHCWGAPKLGPHRFYSKWTPKIINKILGITEEVKVGRIDSLLPSNKERYMRDGIPWDSLCSTFQDAIKVARFLGVKYIWIDSLCILQDGIEFESEGSLMHEVFRNSYCNIAATDSEDGSRGLFRERLPDDVMSTRYTSDGSSPMFGNQTWRIVKEGLWTEDLLEAPLYLRGWVFQGAFKILAERNCSPDVFIERMLSPRSLHFGKRQIYWDCTDTSACETLPNGLSLPLDGQAATDRHWRGRLSESRSNPDPTISGKNDDSIEQFWKVAVENYTSCSLTNQKDKCIAIWSIAKIIGDILKIEYGSGMWQYKLEEQLAWRVADSRTAKRPFDLDSNPSWSWTSVEGAIHLENWWTAERTYTVSDPNGGPIKFQLQSQENDVGLYRKWIKAAYCYFFPAKEDMKSSGDYQPELSCKKIKLKGFLNTGYMRLADSAGTRILDIATSTDHSVDDSLIYAFPDNATRNSVSSRWNLLALTTSRFRSLLTSIQMFLGLKARSNLPLQRPTVQGKMTHFVILALSSPIEIANSSLMVSASEGARLYQGVGIMLEPVMGEANCFVRTGALRIERLKGHMWKRLQTSGTRAGGEDGVNFCII